MLDKDLHDSIRERVNGIMKDAVDLRTGHQSDTIASDILDKGHEIVDLLDENTATDDDQDGEIGYADPDDAPAGDTVTVATADLWLLVNRARKMIRLAREGRIPDQQRRNPLSQIIKKLKRQGLIQRPDNYRDL